MEVHNGALEAALQATGCLKTVTARLLACLKLSETSSFSDTQELFRRPLVEPKPPRQRRPGLPRRHRGGWLLRSPAGGAAAAPRQLGD